MSNTLPPPPVVSPADLDPARQAELRQRAAASGVAPSGGAAPGVHQAIAQAAQRTDVDFDFLLAQAQVESSLNPEAKAPTSSASGLYQFIESTWLETMKRHGERFGLGSVADQIGSGGGGAQVSNPTTRSAILDLRQDPQIASLMAAGLAEDNRAQLMPVLGRQPDHTELYLAHFLGAGGASRFLSELQSDASQVAADLFRSAAGANRNVFYEQGGGARSLAGVMDYLGDKLTSALALSKSDGAGRVAIDQMRMGTSAPTVSANLLQTAAFTIPEAALGPVRIPITTAVGLGEAGSQSAVTVSDLAQAPVTSAAPVTVRPIEQLSRPPRISAAPLEPRSQVRAPVTSPMSSLLSSSFDSEGLGGAMSDAGAAQVKRAYAQLRAMGL